MLKLLHENQMSTNDSTIHIYNSKICAVVWNFVAYTCGAILSSNWVPFKVGMDKDITGKLLYGTFLVGQHILETPLKNSSDGAPPLVWKKVEL